MKRGIIFILLLLLPVVSAVDPQFIFEKDSTPDLEITCKDGLTNDLCAPAFLCNVTVSYPNGTLLFNNSGTSYASPGKYIQPLENLTTIGFYPYFSACTNGTDSGTSEDLFFRVTESGQVFSEAQGLGGLGIIVSVIAISFFFMVLGFRMSNNPKTLPLTLLFVVIAIFLVFYALVLGLNYSVDILEYDGLSNLQSTMFISILWLVSGIAIISFILMTFGFIREFGKGRMMKNFGEGFDPITQTYV